MESVDDFFTLKQKAFDSDDHDNDHYGDDEHNGTEECFLPFVDIGFDQTTQIFSMWLLCYFIENFPGNIKTNFSNPL